MEKENAPDLENTSVQYLVQMFHTNWMKLNPSQYTTACSIAEAVAEQFKEKEIVQELNGIYENAGGGHHLSILECVYFRDMSLGVKLDKNYNYAYKMKPISLSEIIVLLSRAKKRIYTLFTGLCIKHEVRMPPLTLPFFSEGD